MKKIFLFLAFLFAVSFLFAQRPVGNDSFALQTVGSSNTFFKSKGAIGSDSGFVVAKFPDTVSANSSKISHYPGGFIRTGNSTWLRDVTATNWIPFGSFDSTTIYNILNQKLNIIDTVGLWQAQGIYLTNFVRLTDSTVRYVFNFGDAYIDDTSRIAFTQENITNITNIFNYLDSLRGKDTTFIRGPTANGLPFAYSVNDPLSDNDTLHFYFPPNNISEDSVLITDVNGNLKMKLVSAGGGGTLTGGSIAWPGTIYNTPTTGIVSSGLITFSPTLISQSPYTNFGNNTSGSATPTFFTNNFSDSLRRIGVNVSRRVNGVWINQYTDSTGAGGGITGSGAANQGTFWTSASTISGDSNFIFDNTRKAIVIGGPYINPTGTTYIGKINIKCPADSNMLSFENGTSGQIISRMYFAAGDTMTWNLEQNPFQIKNRLSNVYIPSLRISSLGRVDIGNSLMAGVPLALQGKNTGLSLQSSSSITDRIQLFVGNGTTYTNNEGYIYVANTDLHIRTGNPTTTDLMNFTYTNRVGVKTTTPTSTFHNNGSFALAYVAKSGAYTATEDDNTIEVTATGQTITLPTAVGCTGRIYTVKLTASGSGTVATTSSQTIDGSTTYSLSAQYKYVTVMSNNANWIITANN